MAQKKGSTELKVGLFVVVSLLVISFMFYLIGKASRSFDKQITLFSIFDKISGLQEGSLVQLNGIKVGSVKEIQIGQYPKKMKDGTIKKISRIKVFFKIQEKIAKWIREDSIASVDSQGFFGGSIINVTMGQSEKSLPQTGEVKGQNPFGMSDFMALGKDAIASITNSLKKVENILHDPELNKQVGGIVEAVNSMLQRTKTGPGLFHNLIYSKNFANWIDKIMINLKNTTFNVNQSVAQINRVIRQARAKGTFLQRFALSQEGGVLFKRIDGTVKEVQGSIAKVNKLLATSQVPGTLLFKLFKDKKSGTIVDNFVAVSKSTKNIFWKIETGKGSLGALINDPTAYEDFKAILGQIKRNRVFKALVRFLIKRDDNVKGGQISK